MLVEPDRNKVERAMLAYRVFNLAYKAVCQGLGINPSFDEGMKVWRVVEEIAASELTLNPTGAEMNQSGLNLTEAMQQANARSANEQTRMEQEIAKLLVAAREGFHIPPQEPG